MSETPRVDAEASDGWSGDAFCVSMDFARQLKRELTQAQAKCAELEKDLRDLAAGVIVYKGPC